MSIDIAGIGSVADAAKSIIDKFFPDKMNDGERAQAELGLQQILIERENNIVNAQKSVTVAELNQSDSYTKRARPTLVYAGLIFILLVHVVFPMLAFFQGQPMPELSLPEEFWWSWGGVCSVWSVGRTMEKRGGQTKTLDMIVGKK